MSAINETAPSARVVRQAVAHWQALRGDRPMPRRSALDPLDVPALLPYSELIEVLDGGADFRYRVVGSEIDRISSGFYTGKRVSEIPQQSPPSQIFTLYGETVRRGQPVCARLPYVGPLDFILDVEVVTMPLTAADGAVAFLWGVVVPNVPGGG